jgi:CBS domain containing-hemolysin-like protein
MRLAVATAATVVAPAANAVFLSGEALDTAADVVSWIVLLVVPAIVIVLFWIVHVLPEKIAHKRHHPQRAAIQTLCLLSLFFGGLLWPIAWLWAYTKPVGYKLAYGTDKHEDYFDEQQQKLQLKSLPEADLQKLEHELDVMRARGRLPEHLERLRDDVAAQRSQKQPASAPTLTTVVAESRED